LCAFLVTFAACGAAKGVAHSSGRYFGGTEPADQRANFAAQSSAEGGPTVESHKLAAGNPILTNIAVLSFRWQCGIPLDGRYIMAGMIFSGTEQGGDRKHYQTKTHGRFGGLGLTVASGGSPTTINSSTATWPSNALTGQQDSLQLADYDDIYIDKPDQDICRRNDQTLSNIFPERSFATVGKQLLLWNNTEEYGHEPYLLELRQNGEGQSADDVCIGIRTDNDSLKSPGRAVLGMLRTVGPVTPLVRTRRELICR
jgi:hypothetical protein